MNKLIFIILILPSLCFANNLQKADMVFVKKLERKLYLIQNGKPFREYKIALGGNPTGHKQQEGDQRTPEGKYVLDYKKSDSAFYKAIHISYPNEKDKMDARKLGVSPGGAIMIHGQKNGYSWLNLISQSFDWTLGCIAVKNAEMDEIWGFVKVGTPIVIEP